MIFFEYFNLLTKYYSIAGSDTDAGTTPYALNFTVYGVFLLLTYKIITHSFKRVLRAS